MESDRETALLRILADENPWWETGKVPPALSRPFRRRDFYPLREQLDTALITAIAGPRQVGKTTLMYQLIEDLLSRGTAPRSILFLAFDFPRLRAVTDDPITAALEAYALRVLGRPLEDASETVYVFLDEVAKQEGWHAVLKGWYDRRLPLKFVVSDSSHGDVQRGLAESLVGRCSVHVVLPMKFVDYLMFHEGRDDWNDASLRLREGLVASAEEGAPERLYEGFVRIRDRFVTGERRHLARLQEYILKDGYPELLGTIDWTYCTRRLREYASLIFARDLLRHFEVRDPRAMDELVVLIADQTAQRFDYAGLARAVGLNVETVRSYLHYLEGLFLVSSAEFFAPSRAARIRKQRKLYFANVGVANALTGRLGTSLFEVPEVLGRVVETLVHDHCKRLLFTLQPGSLPDLFYWRNYRRQEVDIVLPLRRRPIPIEVKYHAGIRPSDAGPLRDFLEEHDQAPFGLLVTKDALERWGRVVLVPLHWFLLAA